MPINEEVEEKIQEVKDSIREGKLNPQTVEAILKLLIVGSIEKARICCDRLDESACVELQLNPAHLPSYNQPIGPEKNMLKVEFHKSD